MKKILSKSVLPAILLIIAVAIIGSGCGDGSPNVPDEPEADCSDASPIIENAFNNLADSAMDLQIHEYTFTTSVAGSICEIGYQSLQQNTPFVVDNTTISYAIEIVGGPSFTDTFSSSSITYKTFEEPFEITPDVKYTIRRTGGDGLNSSMGHTSNTTFPYTSGNITFLSSNFVDSTSTGGGPVPDNGIPKIYFKFSAD